VFADPASDLIRPIEPDPMEVAAKIASIAECSAI